MNDRSNETPEPVQKFAPKRRARKEGHPTDEAGEALLGLIEEAARLSNENRDRVMEMVHDLSRQLQAQEDRISQLQREVEHFRERSAAAERWLALIQQEIEGTLIGPMMATRRTQAPLH